MEPKTHPFVSKAAKQFSYPTLTNFRTFGNTKDHFFWVRLILSPSLGCAARSATERIAIER